MAAKPREVLYMATLRDSRFTLTLAVLAIAALIGTPTFNMFHDPGWHTIVGAGFAGAACGVVIAANDQALLVQGDCLVIRNAVFVHRIPLSTITSFNHALGLTVVVNSGDIPVAAVRQTNFGVSTKRKHEITEWVRDLEIRREEAQREEAQGLTGKPSRTLKSSWLLQPPAWAIGGLLYGGVLSTDVSKFW